MSNKADNLQPPNTIKLNQANNHITIIKKWLDWKTFSWTLISIVISYLYLQY